MLRRQAWRRFQGSAYLQWACSCRSIGVCELSGTAVADWSFDANLYAGFGELGGGGLDVQEVSVEGVWGLYTYTIEQIPKVPPSLCLFMLRLCILCRCLGHDVFAYDISETRKFRAEGRSETSRCGAVDVKRIFGDLGQIICVHKFPQIDS